ncbi:MAG: NAD(P)-binding domain-containing protein [Bacteroides sp.]|nr:NAD(P)-binding domain-containing protein [Bacteroides sp.]
MTARKLKVAVLGAGNVGVAISADLSLHGHYVALVKTSPSSSKAYKRIRHNWNVVMMKERGEYRKAKIAHVTTDLEIIREADIVFVTVQSTYHEDLVKRIAKYLRRTQIVVCICSYMSSFYFKKYCPFLPAIVETTGPYLEGRVELDDREGEVIFRVGCRLSHSPLSILDPEDVEFCMKRLKELYPGFSHDYNPIESALLNPNMILHTVGAIMSIPRIEYSDGNFCMYREAYSRKNEATMKIMLGLDEEKRKVLSSLGCREIDIFQAGGFRGNPMESFYHYSESSDRAISPTSIRSRYITEDVSQGLVLLESIAKRVGISVPLTSSLITIAGQALGVDFRETGRTIERLGSETYVDNCNRKV